MQPITALRLAYARRPRPATVTSSTGCYNDRRKQAISHFRWLVLLQFYCTCADAYNKRAYKQTSSSYFTFILVLLQLCGVL